jgi:hypothetical protein
MSKSKSSVDGAQCSRWLVSYKQTLQQYGARTSHVVGGSRSRPEELEQGGWCVVVTDGRIALLWHDITSLRPEL